MMATPLTKLLQKDLKFEYKKDMMTFTQQVKENIDINNSELVFCGFGIVAPEYGWNDYDGIDMSGQGKSK